MHRLGWILCVPAFALLIVGFTAGAAPRDDAAVLAKLEELKAQQFVLAHAQMFNHPLAPECRRMEFFPELCRHVDELYLSSKRLYDLTDVEWGRNKRERSEHWHNKLFLVDSHDYDPKVCDLNIGCRRRQGLQIAAGALQFFETNPALKSK